MHFDAHNHAKPEQVPAYNMLLLSASIACGLPATAAIAAIAATTTACPPDTADTAAAAPTTTARRVLKVSI